jgi:hypothetical protein
VVAQTGTSSTEDQLLDAVAIVAPDRDPRDRSQVVDDDD